jgi:hypothetical protein
VPSGSWTRTGHIPTDDTKPNTKTALTDAHTHTETTHADCAHQIHHYHSPKWKSNGPRLIHNHYGFLHLFVGTQSHSRER